MAWRIIEPVLGVQGITDVSETLRHPLGTMVRAKNLTYGEGVFLYLQGATGTSTGSVVVYEQQSSTTTLLDLDYRGPVAVAMADVGASQYGWYQVRGSAVVRVSVAATAGNPAYYVDGGAGAVDDDVVVGGKVDGMAFKTNDGSPSAGFAIVEMAHPSCNGNG